MSGSRLEVLACMDSPSMAAARQRELDIPRETAIALGRSAVDAATRGFYVTRTGQRVVWGDMVGAARALTVSIAPDAALPATGAGVAPCTRIEVANETTLSAARRLVLEGCRPLALNFANGIQPGGGFLYGARAQEECLCRSSALYATLVGDPMYDAHAKRPTPDSTAWAILSPNVPVFRDDLGHELETPWTQSFLTCAAPVASRIGQPLAGDLLAARILRVLEIARAHSYRALVLGAWGCGAFGNDPHRTARDFHAALAGPFAGAFEHVVFAITDWSRERRMLGPFRDAFARAPDAARS